MAKTASSSSKDVLATTTLQANNPEAQRLGLLSKHQVQSGCRDDEQADAGRDCRNLSLETKFSGANNEDREILFHFTCSADHEQDWQPYPPVDPYSCYMCDHIS